MYKLLYSYNYAIFFLLHQQFPCYHGNKRAHKLFQLFLRDCFLLLRYRVWYWSLEFKSLPWNLLSAQKRLEMTINCFKLPITAWNHIERPHTFCPCKLANQKVFLKCLHRFQFAVLLNTKLDISFGSSNGYDFWTLACLETSINCNHNW